MGRIIYQKAYSALALCVYLTSHYTLATPVTLLHIESNNPKVASPKSTIQKRQVQPPSSGIWIQPGSCKDQDQIALENAILDASYLAGAGLHAASNFSNPPFSYFFKDDPATANAVASVYNGVQSAQTGGGPLIIASCEDTEHVCEEGPLAYAAQYNHFQNKPPTIVFCPESLTLPRNPTPCTQNPGGDSLGSVMLHEMSHIWSISGTDKVQDVTGESAHDVNNALVNGVDTTTDAQAFALLGSWAWDMGLGGPPWNEQITCLDRFSQGQFDV